MTVFLQILPIFLFMLVGLGMLLLTQAPIRRLPVMGTLALSFWAGALTITFVITFVAVITGGIFFFLVWPLILGSVAVIVLKWREMKPEGGWRLTRSEAIQWALSIPLLGMIIYNVSRGIMSNMQYEIISYDAVGNFAMKAKLWYFSRELFPDQLLDGEYLMFKRRYPPMIIMSESVWAYLMGRWDGIGIKYFFLACWIGIGLLIYALVKQRGNIISGWLAALIWFALPINIGFVWIGALTGYGDVPLGFGFLVASLALGLWSRELDEKQRWGAAVLVGLMLASTLWTKKEGIPFVAAAGVYLLVRRMHWRQLALVGGICAVFLVVFALSVRGLPSHFEKDISLDLPWIDFKYRLNRFMNLFQTELFKENKWGTRLWRAMTIVWVFKLISLRWRYWFTREVFFLACMFVVYSLVMLLTIFGFERNFDFLYERLMLQVYPMIVVATFAGFALPALPRKRKPTADAETTTLEERPASDDVPASEPV